MNTDGREWRSRLCAASRSGAIFWFAQGLYGAGWILASAESSLVCDIQETKVLLVRMAVSVIVSSVAFSTGMFHRLDTTTVCDNDYICEPRRI